jgi:hypothetical protein
MLEYELVRWHWFPRLPGLVPDASPQRSLPLSCTDERQADLIHIVTG